MKWIALTGGIATGKSTVGGMLKEAGFPVISADDLAHGVLNGAAREAVLKAFGRDLLLTDKSIDRKKLGERVFADRKKLDLLENILHPQIQSGWKHMRKDLEKRGEKIAFYEIPLVFEKKLQSQFDAVIVVACDEKLQIERVKSRNQLSEDDARKRIANQLPMREKIKKADYVIYNNGSLKDLSEEVKKMLKFYQAQE